MELTSSKEGRQERQRPAKFARAPIESALNAGSHPIGIVGVVCGGIG
jgi:hypothetical protein